MSDEQQQRLDRRKLYEVPDDCNEQTYKTNEFKEEVVRLSRRFEEYLIPEGRTSFRSPSSKDKDSSSNRDTTDFSSRELLFKRGSSVHVSSETYHRLQGLQPENESDTDSYKRQQNPPVPPRTASLRNSEFSNQNDDVERLNGTSIPAADNIQISIPKSGSVAVFNTEEMETFLRLLNVEDRIVQRLKRKQIDGKKFAKFKDKDLEDLGIKNPIICYFRDKSKKGLSMFMVL